MTDRNTDRPGATAVARRTTQQSITTSSIEVRGLQRRYGDNVVLRDVDFDVQPGEFVALLGPSGSGKSTLLRTLNGMNKADAGTVRVLGTNPSSCSRSELKQLRTRVGFVFQHFGLVGRMSAMENVLTGALGGLRGPRYGIATYPKKLRIAAVENLERVGLVERRFQRSDTLSGGQQQRVAIARTLMQQPEIVLADEPVASLDPAASRNVLAILKRICAEDGLTVLCSLHQTDLALETSDRIVALVGGRIELDAAASSLTDADLRQIYQGHRP